MMEFFLRTAGSHTRFSFLIFFLISTFYLPALGSDTSKFTSYIETFSQGSIDWDNGMIYGYGRGYIEDYADKKKALSAARVMASSNIVRLAAGLRLNDEHVMESLGKNRISIRLEAFVTYKSEKIQLVSNDPRPYYEIIRMAPIKGVEGLTAQLIDHFKKQPVKWIPPPEQSSETVPNDQDQPWLVLDARHFADTNPVKPAVFPKIITPDGKIIYSVSRVFENALKARGMARYVHSNMTQQQIQSSWNGDLPVFQQLMAFIGPDPVFADSNKKKRVRQKFIVKNVNEAGGLLNTNLVINVKDAEELKEEDAASKILRNCRVIVVVSSPISGIEGMVNNHPALAQSVAPEKINTASDMVEH